MLSLLPFSSPIIMPIRMAVTGVPPLELGGEPGLPGDRLPCRALAGVADLPGRAAHVREAADDEGNGAVGVLLPIDLDGWVLSASSGQLLEH